MGQIIFNGQKPKYCNLVAITTGNHANDVPGAGEVWLIDSTNSSKPGGNGKYDYYIVGDNSKTASQLAANKIKIDDDDDIVIDNTPTSGSDHAVSSNGVYQAIQAIDVSSQISGKADKSEMSVVAGTGANADKTTITLKSGTSATVLTQHQDVSEFIKEGEVFGTGDDYTASFNPYSDTVWNKEQVLSVIQKQQIQENIGISDALATKADISNTYTKSEVNNLIVPANTEISVVSELPASGVANTIYRVAGTTSYSDYGWDGTQFVKLAEYSNAYDAGGALS